MIYLLHSCSHGLILTPIKSIIINPFLILIKINFNNNVYFLYIKEDYIIILKQKIKFFNFLCIVY